ncbi:unnamed protein product [Polarella glacialis]|uniref:catechol O-methyltransferase n=1 Tax=Polarella glacialis TaxID=89957 RepID=A0A813K8D1_POLGL|nr:unnamed protein product [Polarella glacialis]
MSACSQTAAAWSRCLVVFSELRRAGLRPDLASFQCLARACGHGGHWRGALQILVAMREQRIVDSGDVVRSAVAWACEASVEPMSRNVTTARGARKEQKEDALLDFLRQNAATGDLDGAIAAFERFVRECQWLKVAGGQKARLLENSVHPGDRVVEFGTYMGYSALVVARRLRALGGGGRVISCEVDANAAEIARAVILWAGAQHEIDVRIGCAFDWIASGQLGLIDLLVLDHRGERYHTDLQAVEHQLSCRARIFADNVLHPGAPLFLAYIKDRFHTRIHEVKEFLHTPPIDDWVVICTPLSGQRSTQQPLPPEMRRWSAKVDAICQGSQQRTVDWHGFQQDFKRAMYDWNPPGIFAASPRHRSDSGRRS